jgi:hypothetical protein
MNYNIISILLGNDNNTLFGIKNDVLIIYNLFYKFYKKEIYLDNYNWLEPKILYNNNVNLDNLINIIKKYITYENLIIIIYFSGHSNSNGLLKFHNLFIDANTILNLINSKLFYKTHIYFIIDSCFSKNFIIDNNCNNYYNNINKISYLVSCLENEYSKEIEIDYDTQLFNNKQYTTNKLIISIFTFYYIKLLYVRKINNINNFKNIIDDKLWKMISHKYKQTLYFEEQIL